MVIYIRGAIKKDQFFVVDNLRFLSRSITIENENISVGNRLRNGDVEGLPLSPNS